MRNLKEQISKAKEESKHLSEKLLEDERVLRKNHEIYITKQSKIKENKEKAKRPPPAQTNNISQ